MVTNNNRYRPALRYLDLSQAKRERAYATSESGNINSTLMLSYINKIFLPCLRDRMGIEPERKLILFQDNHDSHINEEVLKLLTSQNITFITFPSHSTHLVQMLDIGVFEKFKKEASARVDKKLTFAASQQPPIQLSIHDFPILLQQFYYDIFNADDIKKSFKAACLLPQQPINPDPVIKSLNPRQNYVNLKIRIKEDEEKFLKEKDNPQPEIMQSLEELKAPGALDDKLNDYDTNYFLLKSKLPLRTRLAFGNEVYTQEEVRKLIAAKLQEAKKKEELIEQRKAARKRKNDEEKQKAVRKKQILLKLDAQIAEKKALLKKLDESLKPRKKRKSKEKPDEKDSEKHEEPEPVEKIAEEIDDTEIQQAEEKEEKDEKNLCYCRGEKGIISNWIGCDGGESCPLGGWFHKKCVGLPEDAKPAGLWFCEQCDIDLQVWDE